MPFREPPLTNEIEMVVKRSPLDWESPVYLANRHSVHELPCMRCHGHGMMMPECVYTPAHTCAFCLGTGVEPSSRKRRPGEDE